MVALAAGRRMTPRNCAVPTPLLSAATSAADMTFCSHRACGHDILLRRQDSDAKFPVKFKLAGVAQTGSGLPKGPTKGGQGSWTLPVTYPDCRTLTQAAGKFVACLARAVLGAVVVRGSLDPGRGGLAFAGRLTAVADPPPRRSPPPREACVPVRPVCCGRRACRPGAHAAMP